MIKFYQRGQGQEMKKLEIFKIQLPIATNGELEALVYNKDESTRGMFPVTRELIKLMNGRPKVYFNAFYNEKTTKIEIVSEAKRQAW